MVKFIRDVWAAYWLPVWCSDKQLSRLCHLQPHQLINLANKLHNKNEAIKQNKKGRLWNLKYTLPALVGM